MSQFEESDAQSATPIRLWSELHTSGLLWLINRTVFHPRGYALGVVHQGGLAVGWRLLGDGQAPWAYGDTEDAEFAAAQATLREASGQ